MAEVPESVLLERRTLALLCAIRHGPGVKLETGAIAEDVNVHGVNSDCNSVCRNVDRDECC